MLDVLPPSNGEPIILARIGGAVRPRPMDDGTHRLQTLRRAHQRPPVIEDRLGGDG